SGRLKMSCSRFFASSHRFIAALSRSRKYGRRFRIARQRTIFARSRFRIAHSRFLAAFSGLLESEPASFAAHLLSFIERDPSSKDEEDIKMPTINKSIHRATISLDVPTKIADVILYANNIVQKITNNPNFPPPTPTIAALTL